MSTCNFCHAAAERLRRTVKKSEQNRRRLRKHFAAIADERNRDRVELLATVMLADFGGLGGFAAAWRVYLADASERGGLAMFRAMQVMLRLIETVQSSRPDPREMTDEELERTLSDYLRQHPELVADSLGKLHP